MKIITPSSMAPPGAATTFEAVESTEVPCPVKVPLVVGIDVAGGSMPFVSMSSPMEDHPIKREGGEEKKKKKKLAILKVQHKARPSRSKDNDDLEEGSFNTSDTIQELVDKFALLESGHQLLAYIKRVNRLKSESSRIQKNLQAEVDHLWKRIAEADHLLEQETVEEERRKKAKVRIAKLKDESSRQILEAKIQVVEEFKVSSEMMDLNFAFSKEAFQKEYELCEDRVAGKFSELDLDFLYGDMFDEETGPSAIAADPCPTEAALRAYCQGNRTHAGAQGGP
ncbi:hypothetical protein COCNU_scaffold000208G000010 [Cocos nucifera]|nr:hypothetical protein [Cocos nucifera]